MTLTECILQEKNYSADEKIYLDDKLLGVIREGWEDGSFKIKFIPAS